MAENEKELFECLSNELKLSPGQIKASAAKGDLSRLTQNMDGDKAKRVESILSDPEKGDASGAEPRRAARTIGERSRSSARARRSKRQRGNDVSPHQARAADELLGAK